MERQEANTSEAIPRAKASGIFARKRTAKELKSTVTDPPPDRYFPF